MDDVNAARATFREIEALQERIEELGTRRRAQLTVLLERGLTQRQVARLMGVSQPWISQLMQAKP